ncbi:MAG: chloride channel protein [Pseudomonadota bacterium]
MDAGAQDQVFEISAREARGQILGRLVSLSVRREIVLVLLACVVGVLAGSGATLMSITAHWLHALLFSTGPGGFLSATPDLTSTYMYFVPAVGGLLIGLYALVVKRLRPTPVVDPIEANALEGGKMSLLDSVILSSQTVLGNGFGASVGMEAGYTQWGSGIASAIGQKLNLRRSDLRVLVGCGAAGGIAAAFHAPLAGAFYAFELIIGVYAIPHVAPVMAAALLGYLSAQMLGVVGTPIIIPHVPDIVASDYLLYLLLGFVGAALAILVMRLMTLVEQGFSRSGLPAPLRPVAGGLAVGALALVSPQVLASGESAIHIQVDSAITLSVALILALKILAAACSLGSGFRGGLFSAALFLGSMMGKLFAGVVLLAAPFVHIDPVVAAVVGMAALAVGIVGGPATMTFLVLEATSNLAIAGLVLVAAIACSLTVRLCFGYSFSTWRMHLRGESIRGAHDVGILRELTVARLMQADPPVFPAGGQVADLRARFRDTSVRVVALVDERGAYAGIVRLLTALSADPATPASALAICADCAVQPGMSVQDALRRFEGTQTPVLAVTDGTAQNRPVGMLDEAGALLAYAQALERQRRTLFGEDPAT